jgi:hypothetical protein
MVDVHDTLLKGVSGVFCWLHGLRRPMGNASYISSVGIAAPSPISAVIPHGINPCIGLEPCVRELDGVAGLDREHLSIRRMSHVVPAATCGLQDISGVRRVIIQTSVVVGVGRIRLLEGSRFVTSPI